jgi:hypothetical protein
MKPLKSHVFDPSACRREWHDFRNLMTSKSTLSERKDILPFFRKRQNLSLLISNYFPEQIYNSDRVSHEYQIDSHFVADLVVGDSSRKQYVLVEFEEGKANSIFKTSGKKATRDWARRLEGAYSQLNDWIWKIEDNRSTSNFPAVFGGSNAKFHGLIIIGKGVSLSPQEEARLDWRMEKALIDSKKVNVVTFDQLLLDLDSFLTRLHHV